MLEFRDEKRAIDEPREAVLNLKNHLLSFPLRAWSDVCLERGKNWWVCTTVQVVALFVVAVLVSERTCEAI